MAATATLPPGVTADDLMSIIRMLPDVIFKCFKAEDGKIYWSLNEGGLAERFGLTTEAIRGKSLDELFPGGASDELHEHFEAAFRGEQTIFTNEIEGQHFRHFPQPVLGSDGKVEAVVGFIADVTALVEAERKLAAANEELSAFTYAVSHDLKNPITVLENVARMFELGFQDKLGSQGAKLVTQLRTTVDRMRQIVDDLLSLSRAERAPLERKDVDVTAMVHDAVDALRAAEPERKVKVVVEDGLRMSAEPHLLRVVLDNLLGNAWKYSRTTQGACIEVGEEGGLVVIKDNGVGFEAADDEEIFRPFHRLHGDTFQGTGIGLATVARIVARHEGQIKAHGAPGKGAAFAFTLEAA